MNVPTALKNWVKCNNGECLFFGPTTWMELYSEITFMHPRPDTDFNSRHDVKTYRMRFEYVARADPHVGDYETCAAHIQFWMPPPVIQEDPLP